MATRVNESGHPQPPLGDDELLLGRLDQPREAREAGPVVLVEPVEPQAPGQQGAHDLAEAVVPAVGGVARERLGGRQVGVGAGLRCRRTGSGSSKYG